METVKKARIEEDKEEEEVEEEKVESSCGAGAGVMMMEGSSPPPNVELHPLHNPVVLDVLFSKCGLEELKPLRLVNRLYYDKSLKRWLQLNPTVRLTAFPQIERISQILSSSTDQDDNDSDDIDNYPGWPHYKKYELVSVSLWGGDWSRMEFFWSQAGGWMTHLKLTSCIFEDMRTLRSVLFCRHTPNLESLQLGFELRGRIGSSLFRTDMKDHLDFGRTRNTELALLQQDYVVSLGNNLAPDGGILWTWPNLDGHYRQLEQREKNNPDKVLFPKLTRLVVETVHDQGKDVPFCWVELLSQYPKLKTFHLYIRNEDEEHEPALDGLNRALRALISLRQSDPSRLQLTEFGLMCPRTLVMQPIFGLFQRASLPLHTLNITVPPCELLEFRQALGIQSTVPLRTLNLRADDGTAGVESLLLNFPGFVVPRLDSVTQLAVQGSIFNDMLFLRSCPNLEALTLSNTDLERIMSTTEDWAEGMLLPALKSFKADDGVTTTTTTTGVVQPPGLTRFISTCSNLTTLEMSLTNETLALVCDSWTGLERLKASIAVGNVGTMTTIIPKLKDLVHLDLSIASFSTEQPEPPPPPHHELLNNFILNGILELRKLKFLSLSLPPSTSSSSYQEGICEDILSGLRKNVETVEIIIRSE